MSKNTSPNKEINGRDKDTGQFQVGHTGIGGRPRGSRNKLGERFVSDLLAEWKRSGPECLRRLASENPAAFVRAVGNVLPAQLEAELDVRIGLFQQAADTNQAYRIAMAYLHNKIRNDDDPALIEDHHNGG